MRSSDLLSGAPRIRIQCTARYLSELNSVSWPGQPVSGLTRRRSGRKVVEGRRWRGLNGQSHPRSFPRAPVRPGAGSSVMASYVIPTSGGHLSHFDDGTVSKMFKHTARQVMNDPAKCGSLIASVLDTTITPSQAKQDAEFLADLERQFAAQRPEAARPRA